MLRAMESLYGLSGKPGQVKRQAMERFGPNAGIAQMYLFHAYRKGLLRPETLALAPAPGRPPLTAGDRDKVTMQISKTTRALSAPDRRVDRMKALFIGGTGTISSAITALASSLGWELTLPQPRQQQWETARGRRDHPGGHPRRSVRRAKAPRPALRRGGGFHRLRAGGGGAGLPALCRRTGQYIFISSASALSNTRSTPSSPKAPLCTTPTGSIPATRPPARTR